MKNIDDKYHSLWFSIGGQPLLFYQKELSRAGLKAGLKVFDRFLNNQKWVGKDSM
jgi:hypothetical protein